MPKVITAINTTLDGIADHTAVDPDEAIHDHYSALLLGAGTILYGRTTYELMQYWQTLLKVPSGVKALDDFAVAMDAIPKIVFSNTLESTGWDSATLASRSLEEEVAALKQVPGKNILVGSPSLIIQLLNLGLVDELQLCIHPVLVGSGMQLFEKINRKIKMKLVNVKRFESGAVILAYKF